VDFWQSLLRIENKTEGFCLHTSTNQVETYNNTSLVTFLSQVYSGFGMTDCVEYVFHQIKWLQTHRC
jgi:hypothetical protein